MTAAFVYLIFNTTRNRVMSQVRRLKQPRYAIGLVLGLLYFYSLFFRRRAFGGVGRSPFLGDTVETLAPIFVLLLAAGIWIFGGDRSALAFSEAEVAMLFTAPVPRRGLIIYKLVRTQLLLALNALIWVFLLGRGNSSIPSALTAIGIWSVFTTFSLHRMGIALQRAKHVETRAAGKRQNWIPFLIIAVIGVAVGLSSASESARLRNTPDPFAFMKTFIAILHEPFARNVLLPFRLVVGPMFAHSISDWARAMLPALGIVAMHIVWVLRTDTAFEEAAALASTEQAKRIANMRSRRSGVTVPSGKKAFGTISLASTGNPAIAIVWKNIIALKRTFQSGMLLRLSLLMVLATAGIGWKSHDIPRTVAVMALSMMLVVTIVAVPGFRTDLRSDMLHLPFLKSLPLRGSDLVLAEVISGVIPLFVLQFALLVIAYIATFTAGPMAVSAAARTSILLAAPIPLLAVDFAFFTIANGTAVLFPAWLRLGTGGPGGVEMMGQGMLAMIGSLVALLLLTLFPGLVAAGAYFALRANTPAALMTSSAAGGLMLAIECYFVILMLGESFNSAEPQQVT